VFITTKRATSAPRHLLYKYRPDVQKSFPILFVSKYLSTLYSPDYNVMKNTGCLPASGYAFRRGGRASSLANLGIQKAYPLYIFCWQIVLEPLPITKISGYPSSSGKKKAIDILMSIHILKFIQIWVYGTKSIIFTRSHPIKHIGSIGFITLDFQNVKRVHKAVRNYLS